MVRYLMGLQTHSICGESGIVTWCESNSILSSYAKQFLAPDFIWYPSFYLFFFFSVHVSPPSFIYFFGGARETSTDFFLLRISHCLGNMYNICYCKLKKKFLSSTDLFLFPPPSTPIFSFITTTLLQPYIPTILCPFHFYYRSFKIVLRHCAKYKPGEKERNCTR